tara:strand:+ start:917 stop:1861 length:945 start_codon:yes stop_codon:yes gene_type:complete
MRKIWFNGKILDESEARLSVYDSALMFGDMVFEMTRSFNGVQFKLKEHLDRLIRSGKFVHIPMQEITTGLEAACAEVQEANQFEPDDEHRLMINVSRGTLPMYSEACDTGTNIIITDFPLRWAVAGMGKLFEDGINAVIPSQRAIPAQFLDPKVKSRSRLHYQMANIEVSRYEGENNWALLLDPDGYVTEGTGANLLFVKDEIVVGIETENALRGISRKYVMDLSAEEDNLCWAQVMVCPYDIYSADEAFFTATPFCMLPVTSLNGTPIGYGRPGPVYKRLLAQWSDNVDVDIKAQIQAWDNGAKEGPSAYKFR